MTIPYTHLLAEASFSSFISLLFRWRGSVYKLIWRELMLYLFAFYLLNLVYRFLLSPSEQRTFELLVNFVRDNNYSATYLTFLLGFYVSVVFTRWREQFSSIPWPDTVTLMTICFVTGEDQQSRLIRRTIVRYLNLGFVMTMRSICPAVKNRFPTLNHLVTSGILLPNEEKILLDIKTSYNKYPIPIIWAMSLIQKARNEKRIFSDQAVGQLYYEIDRYRFCLNNLFLMDCVSIPIVYTQVVTMCVYIYFVFLLIGEQFVNAPGTNSAVYNFVYFPFGLAIEFLFYVGWLNVAIVIINPFGDDDDDFDLNMYIDRNYTHNYLLVDQGGKPNPKIQKDPNWESMVDLPFTYPGPQEPSQDKEWAEWNEDVEDGEKGNLKDGKTKHSTIATNVMPEFRSKKENYATPFDNRFEDVKNVKMQPRVNDTSILDPTTIRKRLQDIPADLKRGISVPLPTRNQSEKEKDEKMSKKK